jgi:parallel beta-helix repeat protein
VPIESIDNVTYTFTDSIFNTSIVVQRSNVILDGNGRTLERSTSSDFDIGIYLEYLNNVTIKNANIKGYSIAIRFFQITNSLICGNNITDSVIIGIETAECSRITICKNNVSNGNYGLYLGHSPHSNVTGNIFSGNLQGLEVYGDSLADFTNSIDSTNLVNTKPVYYLMNVQNVTINPSTYPSIGWLALINSTNITVEKLMLTGNGQGLLLAYTTDAKIRNNNTTDNGEGIWLKYSNNNTISENYLSNIGSGIFMSTCSDNIIVGNNFANNFYGIDLWAGADNNAFYGNTLKWNLKGISLRSAKNNRFYHNNFIENGFQTIFDLTSYANIWDDDYPSGGNYWSDYTGKDTNSDAIGDTQRNLAANNTDRYPLIAPITIFDAGTWNNKTYNVDVVSNSTVTNFNFNPDNRTLSFDVEGENGTVGFCRVAIPIDLMWCNNHEEWVVIVNGNLTNRDITETSHTYIYFTYTHSTKKVEIQSVYAVPEFAALVILPLFLIATPLTAIVYRRRQHS